MKTIRVGDVQNSLVRLILWQVGKESITDRHLREAKAFFGDRCAYCDEEKELHFDHAAPINKTSLGQHRVGNLVPSCGNCNQEKGQRDFRQYLCTDPNGDIKIKKILEYMKRHNYVPLNDDKRIKALLEEARKETAEVCRSGCQIHSGDRQVISRWPNRGTAANPRASCRSYASRASFGRLGGIKRITAY
jgi:hypothetical protein